MTKGEAEQRGDPAERAGPPPAPGALPLPEGARRSGTGRKLTGPSPDVAALT